MVPIFLALSIVANMAYSAVFNPDDISTWLNYDISDLQQSIIAKTSHDLKSNGAFIIPGFLHPIVKDRIANELSQTTHIPRTTSRTVFQDKGNFKDFDKNSPRNYMLDNSMEFVSRIHIEKEVQNSYVLSLYNYPPLLHFWREIIQSELYLSTDKAGSVYGFYGRANDWFSWHFDESPFSCIFMIAKSEKGGNFRYIVMDNPLKSNSTDSDVWIELETVLKYEAEVQNQILTINVNEGDVYCMFGNQTLHEVTKVSGAKDRSVFIMTFGNTENFEHTHNVHDLNQWNVEEKVEL